MNEKQTTTSAKHEPTDHGPMALSVSDIELLTRAVQEGWEIPDAAKKIIPSAMVRIVVGRDEENQHYEHDPRVRIAAAQALAAMQRQASGDEKQPDPGDFAGRLSPEEQRSRLLDIARRLHAPDVADDADEQPAEGGDRPIDPPHRDASPAE